MRSNKSPRIVIVGGGSSGWTPNLVKDILLTKELENSTFVLYDINPDMARFVAEACRTIARGLNKPAGNVIATDDRAAAFAGADYFLITISTGGLDAMAHDLKIPERFGIHHTVGDTSGPGGWARFIRNFDVFVGLANDFNRFAPNAPVLNYTNPMTTLTMVLSRLCKAPVVGLCHGLFENLFFLKHLNNLESEEQIATRYAGLNHFFWMTDVRINGVDGLADLRKRLKNKTITDLMRQKPDAFGFSSHRELATELFLHTGALPYLGDRHTCEFIPWGITDTKRMAELKLRRTTIAERRKALASRNAHLRKLIKTGNVEDYTTRSRETAADIIHAHSQGKTFIDVGNMTNVGQVDNLPRGVVVETAVRIDAIGFTPLAYGSLPPHLLAMVEPYAHVFGMVVDACFERNRNKAMQALRLDPVCSKLSTPQVRDMGERLLHAHKKWISVF